VPGGNTNSHAHWKSISYVYAYPDSPGYCYTDS
jgi:hypothetical protein